MIVGQTRIAQIFRATLASGSDDTVLPIALADDLGLDLSNALSHRAWEDGGRLVSYR